MKELVIDRKKWLHGMKDANKSFEDDSGNRTVPGSKLLRSQDGKMCCLGYYLKACGVPLNKLKDVGTPDDVGVILPKSARWLINMDYTSDEADMAMIANDSDKKLREKIIKDIFAKHDVKVKFVGRG